MSQKKKEISKHQSEIIEQLPFAKKLDKKDLNILVSVISSFEKFESPLPKSSEFKEYDSVHKGSAKMILEYIKKEQSYRHKQEPLVMKTFLQDLHYNAQESKRGQIYAFIITILFLGAAFYIASFTKSPALSSLFLAPPLFSVIDRMISNRKKK